MRLLILALLTLKSFSAVAEGCVPALTPPRVGSASAHVLRRSLARNDFKISRTFAMYRDVLQDFDHGPGFAATVKRLGRDDHWIDVGGGLAVPMMQLSRARFDGDQNSFTIDPDHDARLPRMSVVVLSDDFRAPMPTEENLFYRRQFRTFRRDRDPARFRYHAGRPLESYADPAADFGLADVLTDVVGPGAYTEDLTTVLVRELQSLRPGAPAFVNGVFERTTILDCRGRDLSPEAFLARIRGAEVTPGNVRAVDNVEHPRGRLRTFRMRRNADPIFVPPLRLVELRRGLPPYRTFRVTECASR